jgi:hypothetical protein
MNLTASDDHDLQPCCGHPRSAVVSADDLHRGAGDGTNYCAMCAIRARDMGMNDDGIDYSACDECGTLLMNASVDELQFPNGVEVILKCACGQELRKFIRYEEFELWQK